MDPGVRVKIQHSPSQHPIVVVGKGVLANPRRFITQNQRRLDGQIRFLEIDLRDADDVRVIRKRVVQVMNEVAPFGHRHVPVQVQRNPGWLV